MSSPIYNLDEMCDVFCYNSSTWPQDMQEIHRQVLRAYKRHYTRWDMPMKALAVISIEIWKNGVNIEFALEQEFGAPRR